jgi:outer membrane protein
MTLTTPVRSGILVLLAASLFGQAPTAQTPPPAPLSGIPANTPRLTLQEAVAMAVKNHPQVAESENLASAANQVVTENRSAYYPALNGELTGSGGNQQGRIGAGALSASRIFDRFSQGIVLQQLITDSGRTSNLVASSRFSAQSAQQNLAATRYDVILAVDQAYYDVLRAEATIRVARQTVAARQLVVDQTTALAQNGLRSEVDVGFAAVSLSEAKLLLIRAQDQAQRAYAQLGRALGSEQAAGYTLVEEPLPQGPPSDADALVHQAMDARPELRSLEYASQAAHRFERAERDLAFPTVTVLGVGGAIPLISQETLPRVVPNEYAGAAVNVNIPVFNGHLFSARRQEAYYRAIAADQRLRNERQRIARDVRSAWASAYTAYQRLDVTAQLLRQAALAQTLSQGRYNLGLGTIVELTQAQLAQTEAEIENITAKYDYQSENAALQYTLGALR